MVFSAWIAAAEEVENELQYPLEELCNTQIEDLDCERKMGLNQNIVFCYEWIKIGAVLTWKE
jgi:hypothetical protein